MTPTDLETFVRQNYNAIGDTYFSQDEIFSYFLAAMMELAQETRCINRVYTTTSVASQRAYDYPTNAMSLVRVEYDGERIFPNDLIDDDSYTGNNPAETSTGRPQYYQLFGENIYLRPIPDTDALTIRIFTYDLPTLPTSAGTLDIPARYHIYLADYALYRMLLKDKNRQLAADYFNLWKEHKVRAKALEKERVRADSFMVVKDSEMLFEEPRFY